MGRSAGRSTPNIEQLRQEHLIHSSELCTKYNLLVHLHPHLYLASILGLLDFLDVHFQATLHNPPLEDLCVYFRLGFLLPMGPYSMLEEVDARCNRTNQQECWARDQWRKGLIVRGGEFAKSLVEEHERRFEILNEVGRR